MLQIKGDISCLISFAEGTNSLKNLKEKLNYLNCWGEDSEYRINVELNINSILKDPDLSLKFNTTPPIIGGLVYHGDKLWGVHT